MWRGYVELLLEKFHLDIGKFVSLPYFAFCAILLYTFPKSIENDLNNDLTVEEKLKMLYDNEPTFNQGGNCFIIWATLDCSNPEYVKKWNDMSLCPVHQFTTEFSDRNYQ